MGPSFLNYNHQLGFTSVVFPSPPLGLASGYLGTTLHPQHQGWNPPPRPAAPGWVRRVSLTHPGVWNRPSLPLSRSAWLLSGRHTSLLLQQDAGTHREVQTLLFPLSESRSCTPHRCRSTALGSYPLWSIWQKCLHRGEYIWGCSSPIEIVQPALQALAMPSP